MLTCESASTCTTCMTGYVCNSGNCDQCSYACSSCSTNPTTCNNCVTGYVLMSDNTCAACTFPCLTCSH